MLIREHRLTKQKNFERIWKYGESFFIREIGFKILKNDLGISRFAFIVPNKILKKAVSRNRLRRCLREIVRKRLKGIKFGFDCLIIARPGIGELSYQELEEKIERILRKIKLLRD